MRKTWENIKLSRVSINFGLSSIYESQIELDNFVLCTFLLVRSIWIVEMQFKRNIIYQVLIELSKKKKYRNFESWETIFIASRLFNL